MSRRYVIPALLFTFVILLTVPALAQDGVQAIGACTVIDKPGSYVLAKNITATYRDLKSVAAERTPACIVIVADFVSLDLQGRTIAGPGWPTDKDVVGIYSTGDISGKTPIATHIRNGCVTKFERGIAFEGAGHTVEGVRVAGNGAGISMDGDGIRVKDVVAVSNWWGILSFGGNGQSVEHCQVNSNLGHGIYQWPDSERLSLGSRIVGNTVSGNALYGIYAHCPSVILQNMVYKNGSDQDGWHDIVLVPGSSDCTLSDNNPVVPEYQGP